MKTWKVRRKLSTYTVEASSRNKAKYEAYKAYRRRKRNPMAFFPWVIGVSKAVAID